MIAAAKQKDKKTSLISQQEQVPGKEETFKTSMRLSLCLQTAYILLGWFV